MGLFDWFKKRRYDDLCDEELPDEEFEVDATVEYAFDAIVAICADGEHMDALDPHQRILYVTQTLEQEVNNGGFSQYFYNSAGDLANELIAAFTAIGAYKTAAICQKALSAFRDGVPTDRAERQALLERLHSDKLWEKCDDAFYEYEDDLESLNRAYILAHPDSFDN